MIALKRTALLLIMLFSLALSACATHHYEGAAAGGAIGGIAGALLDSRNPWRGGVVGAGLGAVAGATIADISVRGSREAAVSGKVVEYRTHDGHGMYRAEPVGNYYHHDEHTRCRKVREKTWENGRLVRNRIKEVCESTGYGGYQGHDERC